MRAVQISLGNRVHTGQKTQRSFCAQAPRSRLQRRARACAEMRRQQRGSGEEGVARVTLVRVRVVFFTFWFLSFFTSTFFLVSASAISMMSSADGASPSIERLILRERKRERARAGGGGSGRRETACGSRYASGWMRVDERRVRLDGG